MPSARLLARTASRRVILLALTTALAAALVSLASTEAGLACGGPPPKPLRALYTESDLVVVARLGQTVPVLVATADENFRVYLTKTELRVSSTVKGKGNHGVVPLYQVRWEAINQEEGEHEYHPSADTDNDQMLFFLRQREDGEGYEETDKYYGVKKLSDADLRAYVERMDELALILQQEKPDPARIVEWLVRCAEEPATRWEGLYELSNSKYVADAKAAEEKEAGGEEAADGAGGAGGEGDAEANHAGADSGEETAEAGASSEAKEGEGESAITDPQFARMLNPRESYYTPDPELVGLLTADQKNRLADVLFNVKQVTDEEATLIELVKEWRDPRFVPFALAQLRGFGDEPPLVAESLATALAEALGDEGLIKLARKYGEAAVYYDDPEEGEAGGEAAGEEVAAAAEGAAAAAAAAESAEAETETDPAEKSFEDSLAGNSAQKRSQRLQRFIARAEVALAH